MYSEWEKVTECLPDDYIYVLVYAEMKGKNEPCPISIARYHSSEWFMMSDEKENNAVAYGDLTWGMNPEDITHWMPLQIAPNRE